MAEKIGDLTMTELEQIVDRIVDERLRKSNLVMHEVGQRDPTQMERLRRNLIRRVPGVPSPTQLLFEDRDQWYKPTS